MLSYVINSIASHLLYEALLCDAPLLCISVICISFVDFDFHTFKIIIFHYLLFLTTNVICTIIIVTFFSDVWKLFCNSIKRYMYHIFRKIFIYITTKYNNYWEIKGQEYERPSHVHHSSVNCSSSGFFQLPSKSNYKLRTRSIYHELNGRLVGLS